MALRFEPRRFFLKGKVTKQTSYKHSICQVEILYYFNHSYLLYWLSLFISKIKLYLFIFTSVVSRTWFLLLCDHVDILIYFLSYIIQHCPDIIWIKYILEQVILKAVSPLIICYFSSNNNNNNNEGFYIALKLRKYWYQSALQ